MAVGSNNLRLSETISDQPVVSIVIPTRNRCALLQETVASVLAQTFSRWELIVIDDASDDETPAYLSGLHDRRLTAIRLEQHAERSAARNRGLERAAGEFILFLDDDDLLEAAAVQTHLNAFKKYPAAVAAIGGFIKFNAEGVRMTVKIVRRRYNRDLWPDVLLGWSPACGQCLFRTAAMRQVNGWDTNYNICEDHELWLRLARLGPAVLLPEVVYRSRTHSGQWRPPQRNVQKLMNEMRERAVKKIAGEERKPAERILAARNCRRIATRHYRSAENFKALRAYLKVIRLVPGVLGSPLLRPRLLAPMMKCLVGGEAVFLRLQRLAGRKKADYSVRAIVKSSAGRTPLTTPMLHEEEN